MGSSNSTAALQNEIYSNSLNETFNSCGSSCTSDVTNTSNIVVNSTIDGNFTGASAQCQANTTCVVSNSLDTNVSTIASNVLTQSNTSVSDLLGFLTSDNNVADLETSITNIITQVVANTCQANSLSETNNTFNYLSNDTVGGDYLGAVASGNSTNYCTLNNISKITAYNQVQNDSDQSNVSVGLLGIIFGAIILVAGIALIIVIVLVVGIGGIFGVKALGGKKGSTGGAAPVSPFESAVQEEQLALGL